MKINVTRFWIVLMGLLSVVAYGCAKDDIYQDNLSSSDKGFASLAIVNAVPSSVRMDAFLREKKFNTTAELLSSGQKTAYRNVYSGRQLFSLTNYLQTGSEILHDELDLIANKIYSVFIFRDGSLQMMHSEDFIVKPGNGKAKLRIVHLSPDASSLDIAVTNNTGVFRNVNFKTVSEFEEVEANKSGYITIKNTAQKIDLQVAFNPQNQEIYTLLIKGVVKATDEHEQLSAVLLK